MRLYLGLYYIPASCRRLQVLRFEARWQGFIAAGLPAAAADPTILRLYHPIGQMLTAPGIPPGGMPWDLSWAHFGLNIRAMRRHLAGIINNRRNWTQ